MEALTQSLKIGAALAVLVLVAIYALPERPSLFAGRGEVAPTQTAQLPAEPSVEAPSPAPTTAPAAEAEAPAPASAPAPAEPTVGQQHLERLRAGTGRPAESAPPAEAATEPPAEPAPDAPVQPPVAAEAPAETPEQIPEPASDPQRGLADLTEPAPAPSFRLFRDAAAGDAATIFTEDQTIDIAGVEPPATGARCAGGSCEDEARAALSDFLSGRSLLCAVDTRAGPRTTAPCLAGEDDVGQWLVSNGWASAAPGSRYAQDEEAARANGLGIWGGD